MPGKSVRVIGRALGAAFVATALVRALFDAYGHVGAFLNVLPKPIAHFIASANGTVFLVVCGLAVLFFALRNEASPESSDLAAIRAKLDEQAPRNLTPEQRATIVAAIRSLTRDDATTVNDRCAWVYSVSSVHDSDAYAAQIRHALREGGISCSQATSLPEGFESRFGDGLTLHGFDKMHPSTREVIRDALLAAEIPVIDTPSATPGKGLVSLIVGRRMTATTPANLQLVEENLRLRKSLMAAVPRQLSSHQRGVITSSLESFITRHKDRSALPSIHILAGEGPDCGDYARQFEEVFTSVGVRVDRHSPPEHPEDDFYYGLWVRWDPKWRAKYGFPDDGPPVATALRQAGIAVTVVEREGSFTSLIVGSRIVP